jgi:predicted CopG family antitoxin
MEEEEKISIKRVPMGSTQQVRLDRELVGLLYQMKKYKETYSDVIRRVLRAPKIKK